MSSNNSIYCPQCAAPNDPDATSCVECGTELQEARSSNITNLVLGALLVLLVLGLFMASETSDSDHDEGGYYNDRGVWVVPVSSRSGSLGRSRSGSRSGGFGFGK